MMDKKTHEVVDRSSTERKTKLIVDVPVDSSRYGRGLCSGNLDIPASHDAGVQVQCSLGRCTSPRLS